MVPAEARQILNSRLLHFAVLGGAIFALSPRPPSRRDIDLDTRSLRALEAAEAQRLGRAALDPEQAKSVRDRAIEDELLYREALRLGLDRADAIVKQRLIQRVLFLAEDLAGAASPPTPAQLEAFYASTESEWRAPPRRRFIHVYAGPAHRDALVSIRATLLASGAVAEDPPDLGEAFPLPRSVRATKDAVARDYGAEFAERVFALPAQEWSEPLSSKFGWHLVRVLEESGGGPASIDEVRGQLEIAYLLARKKRAVAEFLGRASDRYRIRVDGVRVDDWSPVGRTPPPRSAPAGD
jgi:hypothetical protein